MKIYGENYGEVINNLLNCIKADIRDIVFESVKMALAEHEEETRPQKMYSRNEVCALLGISMMTLYNITKEGYIVETKVGRRVLYSEDSINDYLQSGKFRQTIAYDKQSKEKKKNMTMKTYIMHDNSTGLYKIGIAINPHFREKTLRSDKPTVDLLYICYGNKERELHGLYAQKRVRGEWFNLSEDDINDIVANYGFIKPQ